MATRAHELASPHRAPRSPAFQPDYPDEVTGEQLEAIRRFIDRDGDNASNRTMIDSPGW